eukprot:jgi/Bigna1/85534/estExt_fgenesh1_pg.C_40316
MRRGRYGADNEPPRAPLLCALVIFSIIAGLLHEDFIPQRSAAHTMKLKHVHYIQPRYRGGDLTFSPNPLLNVSIVEPERLVFGQDREFEEGYNQDDDAFKKKRKNYVELSQREIELLNKKEPGEGRDAALQRDSLELEFEKLFSAERRGKWQIKDKSIRLDRWKARKQAAEHCFQRTNQTAKAYLLFQLASLWVQPRFNLNRIAKQHEKKNNCQRPDEKNKDASQSSDNEESNYTPQIEAEELPNAEKWASSLLNSALCLLRMGYPLKSIEECNDVIRVLTQISKIATTHNKGKLEFYHAKALYRKAQFCNTSHLFENQELYARVVAASAPSGRIDHEIEEEKEERRIEPDVAPRGRGGGHKAETDIDLGVGAESKSKFQAAAAAAVSSRNGINETGKLDDTNDNKNYVLLPPPNAIDSDDSEFAEKRREKEESAGVRKEISQVLNMSLPSSRSTSSSDDAANDRNGHKSSSSVEKASSSTEPDNQRYLYRAFEALEVSQRLMEDPITRRYLPHDAAKKLIGSNQGTKTGSTTTNVVAETPAVTTAAPNSYTERNTTGANMTGSNTAGEVTSNTGASSQIKSENQQQDDDDHHQLFDSYYNKWEKLEKDISDDEAPLLTAEEREYRNQLLTQHPRPPHQQQRRFTLIDDEDQRDTALYPDLFKERIPSKEEIDKMTAAQQPRQPNSNRRLPYRTAFKEIEEMERREKSTQRETNDASGDDEDDPCTRQQIRDLERQSNKFEPLGSSVDDAWRKVFASSNNTDARASATTNGTKTKNFGSDVFDRYQHLELSDSATDLEFNTIKKECPESARKGPAREKEAKQADPSHFTTQNLSENEDKYRELFDRLRKAQNEVQQQRDEEARKSGKLYIEN